MGTHAFKQGCTSCSEPTALYALNRRDILITTGTNELWLSGVGTKKGPGALAFAMTSGAGVPRRSVISSNWCTTLRPGNRGFPSRISANMQPTDQMSMAVEYFAKKDPQSSGARYLFHTQPQVRWMQICQKSMPSSLFQDEFCTACICQLQEAHTISWPHSLSRIWLWACH